jgi:DNA-3-methyladenine glycosylase II
MEFNIKPVAPFSFDLSARIFSDRDQRIRKYEEDAYWQVVRLNRNLVLVSLRSFGTVDEPEISVNLMPDEGLSGDDAKAAEPIIRSLFNMDLDLQPFYKAVEGDKVMAKLVLQLRGLRSPCTQTVFEALVDSIVEQQISLKVAWSLQRRLTEAFGDALSLGDKTYYAFPEPERLASATIEQLHNCGLSTRKAEYVRDISRLAKDGLDPERFKDYRDQEKIVEEMTQIRGVGVWTAELTMVRGMQKLDAIPADDMGLRRCISHYYCHDRKIEGAEARKIAQNWKGWRGLASFYLIMAERLGLKP